MLKFINFNIALNLIEPSKLQPAQKSLCRFIDAENRLFKIIEKL